MERDAAPLRAGNSRKRNAAALHARRVARCFEADVWGIRDPRRVSHGRVQAPRVHRAHTGPVLLVRSAPRNCYVLVPAHYSSERPGLRRLDVTKEDFISIV